MCAAPCLRLPKVASGAHPQAGSAPCLGQSCALGVQGGAGCWMLCLYNAEDLLWDSIFSLLVLCCCFSGPAHPDRLSWELIAISMRIVPSPLLLLFVTFGLH